MIIFLLILATVILGGSYFSYRIAFHAPDELRGKHQSVKAPQYDPYRPRMRELFRDFSERPFEVVTIRSRDGLKLSARYYHTADGAPLDICCHGYKSHPITDFSGGSRLSFDMGHNLLLIDQRSQHDSEGHTITFGILERWDVLFWVNYAVDRFGQDVKITLYGVSMGGATVLMASGLPLPEQVKGIVADCPFAVPEEIILDVGKKQHYPPKLIRPFLHMGAWLYGGFRLSETDAVRAVAKTKVPIVIIHGEEDRFVPQEMSARLTVREGVERHSFPDAGHGISAILHTEEYNELVQRFLERCAK